MAGKRMADIVQRLADEYEAAKAELTAKL